MPAQIARMRSRISARTPSSKARTVPQSLRLAGDDVVGRAGMDLGDRQHRGLERIDIAADDGLQRLRQASSR